MKKEVRFGVIHIESDHNEKFVDAGHALMAMQTMQAWMAIQNYLVCSSINLEFGRIELTVHIDGKQMPVLPPAYKYTWRDISSHTYWSEPRNCSDRVRCIDYHFEYKK